MNGVPLAKPTTQKGFSGVLRGNAVYKATKLEVAVFDARMKVHSLQTVGELITAIKTAVRLNAVGKNQVIRYFVDEPGMTWHDHL